MKRLSLRNDSSNETQQDKMCGGQCTRREAVLAGLHIAVVGFSILTAVLLALNKLEQKANDCPYANRYDDNHFTFYPSNYLCDTGLYWALLSAALAFLFVMVNWVAAVHRSLKWQRWQFVLTFIGVAGMVTATAINTSGVVLWCQNLLHQRQGPNVHKQYTSCFAAAKDWDIFKRESKEAKAADMYNLVIPAEVFMVLLTVLWQVMAALTIYVTLYRIQEHRNNMAAEADADADDARSDTELIRA